MKIAGQDGVARMDIAGLHVPYSRLMVDGVGPPNHIHKVTNGQLVNIPVNAGNVIHVLIHAHHLHHLGKTHLTMSELRDQYERKVEYCWRFIFVAMYILYLHIEYISN